MILRPYQTKAVADVQDALPTHRSVVLSLPTGAGKTQVASDLIRSLRLPTLFVAHRRELIAQAAARLRSFDVPCGVIMGGHPRTPEPVQVASIQSLARRDLPPVGLLVIDEAHRACSATYRALLAKLPTVPTVGLTATPFRLDGKGLRDIFAHLVAGPLAADLCADGYLVPASVLVPPGAVLDDVPVRAGDFVQAPLAAAVNRPQLVGDVVKHLLKYGRPPIMGFAVGIEHSKALAAACCAAGIAAEHLDGETDRDQRAAVLARLATGETKAVWNADLFGEGLDLPAIETVVLARPTQSLGLFMQQIGRGARPTPAKKDFVVLDHGGNYARFFERLTPRWFGTRLVVDVVGVTLDGPPPKRPRDGASGARRCPRCFILNPPGAADCWSCGAPLPPPAKKPPPKPLAADLVPLTPSEQRAATWDDKKAWWAAHGTEKLASALFRERFRHYPPVYHGRLLSPTDPADDEYRRRLLAGTVRAMGERGRFVVHAKFAGQWRLPPVSV